MQNAQPLQNVNLYLPELQPSKEWLTTPVLASTVAGFIVLLTCFAIYLNFQLGELDKQAVQMLATVQSERDSLENTRKKIPTSKGEDLDKQIDELKSHVRNLSLVAELIESQNLGNDQGFALRLHSLASHASSDLSLSSFRFSQGDRKVELAGETASPQSLTQFIDALQHDDYFRGAQFGPLAVQQDADKPGRHHFTLGYKQVFDASKKLVEANR